MSKSLPPTSEPLFIVEQDSMSLVLVGSTDTKNEMNVSLDKGLDQTWCPNIYCVPTLVTHLLFQILAWGDRLRAAVNCLAYLLGGVVPACIVRGRRQ